MSGAVPRLVREAADALEHPPAVALQHCGADGDGSVPIPARSYLSASEILCIVCPHLLIAERPVRLMIHHHDATWQAMCGHEDRSADGSGCRTVGVHHRFQRQADPHELKTMPMKRIAEWIDGK